MSRGGDGIAFITYYFPPCGGSGVLRIVRFVKNLGAYGWIPYVVTVDQRDIPSLAYGSMAKDDSYERIDGLAGTLLVRLRRPSRILFACLRAFSNAVRGAKSIVSRSRTAAPAAGAKNYYSSDAGSLLKLFFEIILITDQIFEWAPAAIVRGARYVKRNGVGVICSSSPPWSVHLVGLCLKYLCRKTWVMDLRDPIAGIDGARAGSVAQPRVVGGFLRALESFLVRRADLVVCNCEEIRDYYRRRYPGKRFEFVTNGFDPAEFEGNGSAPTGSAMKHISHFGELYSTIRTPEPFLKAVAAVFADRPETKKSLTIDFYGAAQYVRSGEFEETLRDLAIGPSVRCYDYIPHREVIARMRGSDALLLLQPHSSTNFQIPAKLYEYIATGRPMIAVAPEDSATSNLIRRYGLGTVHEPGDLSGMMGSILAVIEGTAPRPRGDSVAHFSAQETTGRFARILGDAVGRRDIGPQGSTVP